MHRDIYHFMDIGEIKQRLELALRSAEPLALEGVLIKFLGVASCGGQ